MTTDTYADTPVYYWYTSKSQIEGDYRTYWINGEQYIGLTKEASYEEIERYDLREKGIGDMDWLRGEGK